MKVVKQALDLTIHVLQRTVAAIISSIILLTLLIMAIISNLFRGDNDEIDEAPKNGDDKEEIDSKMFAQKYGFSCEEHTTVTEDGFVLHLKRVNSPNLMNPNLSPIILQHGLFQSDGIFMTNERDSLAFYFAERGYDVWLGNNRGVVCKHKQLSHEDEQFWDWSLDQLGKYDFPAILKYVCEKTGHEKCVYVGHSQGNAQAFVGFTLRPEVNDRLKLFVALAPALYINEMRHWALRALVKTPEWLFTFLFGNKSFIPIMNLFQRILPTRVFTFFAYNMFCFLFNWDHGRWVKWRKNKYFQFTPKPLSSKLVLHWTKIIRNRQLCSFDSDVHYNVANITCPVAVFDGGADSLVDGPRVQSEMKAKQVRLCHFERVDGYEHMDLLWSKESKTTVFEPLLKVIVACDV